MKPRKRNPKAPSPWLGDFKTTPHRLAFVKCFYYDDEKREVTGPISMLDVQLLVDSNNLPVETLVMLKGGDIWRPYWEEEYKICPQDVALHKFRMASQTWVYYSVNGQVSEPLLLSQLHRMIQAGTLPPDVPVCKAGTEDWKNVSEI